MASDGLGCILFAEEFDDLICSGAVEYLLQLCVGESQGDGGEGNGGVLKLVAGFFTTIVVVSVSGGWGEKVLGEVVGCQEHGDAVLPEKEVLPVKGGDSLLDVSELHG
jgi:hypothetical protein